MKNLTPSFRCPARVLLALLTSGLTCSSDANSYSGLIQGQDGLLYGTTYDGGADGYGSTYRATTNGAFLRLYSFTNGLDGSYPVASLIQGTNGNFYGTTTWGGSHSSGTVFQMLPNGAVTSLYSFTGGNDGDSPYGALLQGSDGNFYGTTAFGGSNSLGAIFKMTPGGAITPLFSFTGINDGAYPYAGLIQGADGNFYGTTAFGGTHDAGSIFKITAGGVITRSYSFTGGADGDSPLAGLLQGSDDNFYGTTYEGGTGDVGTVFKMDTNGAFSTLYSFSDTDGALPFAGLVQGTDGNLYGTTELGGPGQAGTVFTITTNGVLNPIIWFTGANGAYPNGTLVQASDGYFYGTTSYADADDYGAMFRFAIPGPPWITVQPSNVVEFIGANVTFTISASSDSVAPLFYQWQVNGTNLADSGIFSGCTTRTLTLTNISPANAGTYSAIVTNFVGSVTSVGATLTLTSSPPVITLQPANQFVLPGGTALFSVAAIGNLPFLYRWQHDGTNLADGLNVSGATASRLVISNAGVSDAGIYSAIISNSAGSTVSTGAVFVIVTPPSIVTQPFHQVVALGGTASFTVVADGTAPLSFLWQRNNTNVSNGGHYSGSTTPTLTISGADTNDAASYRCVVTNAYGSTNSSAATLTVNSPPGITQQPSHQFAALGEIGSFTVAANGTAPLSFLWQKNNADLSDDGHHSGSTTPTLTVTDVNNNDFATYRCVVTNAFGSTNSAAVTLTEITLNPCFGMLNPDFESGFSLAGGGYIATNWTEWEASPGVAVGFDETAIVHGGGHSQRIRVSGGTNGTSGGIYQRVPVTPGQPYLISVWMYAGDTLTTCSLGVDPVGGTNANSGVTWSAASTNVAWVQRPWSGTATTNYLTVFFKVTSLDNVKRNGYFDDATPAVATGPVRLVARRSGKELTLTWPECPGARLERADNLSEPVSWATATNQASIGGGQKTVTLTPTGNAGYFRLVRE
jgi:uncharacterized repeat protein (TIGR03803 family)